MADYKTNTSELTAVANAIRAKGNTDLPLEYPEGFINAISNISSSGAPAKKDVNFIDYDGTLLHSYTKDEISSMSSDSDLPANPSHGGLTAQGWNWTLAQIKTQLLAMPDTPITVGQMYITQSGATEIDVIMQEGRLEPILTVCVKGTITIDWGDNTTPDTVAGTSLTKRQAVPHTYAQAGAYTISINATGDNQYSFYGSTSYSLLRKNASDNENKTYSSTVQNVRIGKNISLDGYAFHNCFSLLTITIPKGITSIGSYAFSNCYSLASIVIPDSVTSIGTNAFYNCHALSIVAISTSVTIIKNYAFYSCTSLANIEIPNSVTSIGNNVFSLCQSLTNIVIPYGIASVPDSMLQNSFSIVNITIPDSVTSIGIYAFGSCYSLTSIEIPDDVTSIGNYAFSNCYSLSSITIPDDVTSIGNYAFSNCYSLASIVIPDSVTSIGNNAFSGCWGVAEYHFLSTTVPTGGTNMFGSMPSDCIIYVPYSADHSILEAYKSAANWSTYASYIQEEPAS